MHNFVHFIHSTLQRVRYCRHPKARVYAHKAYNEYIQDKYHIHMNSTSWHTLSEFVTYLGREGHCKVEDTPKGWLIAVIHRDTDAVRPCFCRWCSDYQYCSIFTQEFTQSG